MKQVMLIYNYNEGASDEKASDTAKRDIEAVMLGSSMQYIYYFGNLAYLNEWRIKKARVEIDDIEVLVSVGGEPVMVNKYGAIVNRWPKPLMVTVYQAEKVLMEATDRKREERGR